MHRYALAALAIAISATYASPSKQEAAGPQPLEKRAIITTTIDDEYDFVIVGGGLAGLVIGNRLSADPDNKVLVLEAGSDGSQYAAEINSPSQAYYGDLWSDNTNWNFKCTPQPGLNGYAMPWPRGKVLGGSSAINGMYLTRPSSDEINKWHDMIEGMPGADNWSWDTLFAAMKKSEKFQPTTQAIAKEGGITWNAASHGTTGAIDATWPGVTFPLLNDWSQSCAAAGLPATKDAYGGNAMGAYIATSAIDPDGWTRSYSKSGYLDYLPPRSNYAVLANALVTKVEFATGGDKLLATGVEYSPDGGKTTKSVKVKKDVILSGGAIGSPVVLQHSGIGPSDVLNKAGVKVLYELSGVGAHMQDHLSIQTQWHTTQETAGEMYDDGDRDPAFLSYVNDAVAFPNSDVLFGNGVGAMKNTIMSNLKSPFTDASVSAGYTAIAKATADIFSTSTNSGQVELLLGNDLANATVRMQVALQHPYSQGRLYITSSDPTVYPTIDPAYLSHPADAQILIAGLKLARKIGTSGPLANVLTETYPGTDVQSDDDWDKWLRNNAFTEFHPTGTSAMLPEELGGVIDGNMIVHGTSNLRVADAGIAPIEFGAHLMASTYGIGERAAEIIIDYYNSPGAKTVAESLDAKAMAKSPKGGSGSPNAATNMHSISPLVTMFAFIIVLAFPFL